MHIPRRRDAGADGTRWSEREQSICGMAAGGNKGDAGTSPPREPARTREKGGIAKEEKGLTGARGLAALYVFSYHSLALYWVYLGIPITTATVAYFSPYSFITSGCGIDFFFILTAYLLTKKMRRGDYPSLRYYFTKRIFRIWPLFYITLILVALLGIFQPSWLAFVFASNYFPSTFSNTPLWTLMVEELFYIILPLWIKLFVNGRMKYTLPVLVLVTVSYKIMSPASDIEFYDKQIPAYLLDYALGTSLGLGVNVRLGQWKYPCLGLFTAYALTFPNGYVWFAHLPYAVFYFFVIGNFANSRLLVNSISVFLGKVSYPLSMFGTFILTRLDSAVFQGMFNLADPLQAVAWLAVSFTASLSLAVLAHRFIEKPGIIMGEKVIARLKLVTGAKGPGIVSGEVSIPGVVR